MHDVLARVVSQEATKLDAMSASSGDLLPESALKALEMLARCAKSLKSDGPDQKSDEQPSTEEALALVEGG